MSVKFVGNSAQRVRLASALVTIPYTASCWWRPDGLVQPNDGTLFGMANNTLVSHRTGMRIRDSGAARPGSLATRYRTASEDVSALTDMRAYPNGSRWWHCALTVTSTQSRVFLNYRTQASVSYTTTPTLNNTSFGALNNGGSWVEPARGLIAHVAAWDRILEDAEIAALFQRVNPMEIAGTAAYLPLTHSRTLDVADDSNSWLVDGDPPLHPDNPPVLAPTEWEFLPLSEAAALPAATDNNKYALLNYLQVYRHQVPLPVDPVMTQGDKQQILWGYPNILWESTGGVGVPIWHLMQHHSGGTP